MELLAPVVLGILVVVAVGAFAPRVGVAGPLLLVLIGAGVSLLPFVPDVHISPDLVLQLVLPPLLYSSAITVPTMDFRRDLGIISGLSVVLVLVTSVLVGLLVTRLVPGLGLAGGIAVGAVVSPTDAVATSLVRRSGAAPRVATVLEGEAMLNDASALVLLRSAVAATAATVSVWHVAGDLVRAVVVAVLVGGLVGRANLVVRRRLTNPAASVAVSIVAPFVAVLGSEPFGGSGLVAAVAAGLVTGHRGPRDLAAADRLAEGAVWRTVELVAEGGVFLLMGLQADGLLHLVRAEHSSAWLAVRVGAAVATLVVAVRAAFVAPSLWALARRYRHTEAQRSRLDELSRRLDDPARTAARSWGTHAPDPAAAQAQANRLREMVARRTADLDYLADQRLGPKEGTVMVWAGMRGAVTVAAAQSLPADTPQRALLVLVAFVVAAGTLLVQGATLPLLVARLHLATHTDDDAARAALRAQLLGAAARRLSQPGLTGADGQPFSTELLARMRRELEPLQRRLLADHDDDAAAQPDAAALEGRARIRAQYKALRGALIDAQRAELVRLRDLGSYPSAVLDEALDQLDADQLGLDMR